MFDSLHPVCYVANESKNRTGPVRFLMVYGESFVDQQCGVFYLEMG